MIGRGLDGSAVAVHSMLSANDMQGATCSGPFDLSNYDTAMLIVSLGSVNTNAQFVVQRSSTSNGTFAAFGASVGANTGSQVLVRSFGLQTSNVWHRLYAVNGTGSATAAAVLVAQGARFVPVTQPTGTTVHSFVTAAK